MLKKDYVLAILLLILCFVAHSFADSTVTNIPPIININKISNPESKVFESSIFESKIQKQAFLNESSYTYVPNIESITESSILIFTKESANHPPLPAQYSNNLLQELLEIVFNKKKVSDEPELTYNNESTLCLSKFSLQKLGEDNGKLFYYLYQNPETKQIYNCFVDGLNQQKIIINHSVGIASITVSSSQLHSNKIDFNAPNKPVYPVDSIYSNITQYQVTQSNTAALGSQQNSTSLGLANTTTTPIGALIHSYSVSPSGVYPVNRGTTTWETDFQSPMTSLLLGDTTPSAGGWGASIPYAGIHYGTNMILRPNTNFQAQNPSFSGVVDNPSQLQLLSNGQNINNPIDLTTGPYNVNNPPVANGAGNLLVNIKTESGAIYQTMNIPFYNDSHIFAQDLYLYEYNFGLPSNNQGAGGFNLNYSINNPIFSTTHTYGLSNYYTPQIHLEAQQNGFANLGITHNFTLYDYFFFAISNAYSQNSGGGGYLNQFNISHQPTGSNSLQYGYSILQNSDNFNNLNGVNTDQVSQSLSSSIATDYGLSLSGNYSLNTSSATGSTTAIGLRATYQIHRLLSQIGVTQSNSSFNSSTLGLYLNLSYSLENSSYSASAQSINNQNTYTTNYAYNDPSNIWNANIGNQYADGSANPNTFNGGGSYNFKNATAVSSLSYGSGNNYSAQNSLQGTMVIAQNGINFGRASSGSFAIVQVGLPNIGILQGDTYIGSTDSSGQFILPNLTPYFPQVIRIRQEDLPLNTLLDTYSQTVIPPLNGGVMVVFKANHYLPATVHLTYDKNKVPPTGFTADIIDNETKKTMEDDVIADDGMVLINKFQPDKSYTIEFSLNSGTYACKISKDNIDSKSSNQYSTVLKDVKCELKP